MTKLYIKKLHICQNPYKFKTCILAFKRSIRNLNSLDYNFGILTSSQKENSLIFYTTGTTNRFLLICSSLIPSFLQTSHIHLNIHIVATCTFASYFFIGCQHLVLHKRADIIIISLKKGP